MKWFEGNESELVWRVAATQTARANTCVVPARQHVFSPMPAEANSGGVLPG